MNNSEVVVIAVATAYSESPRYKIKSRYEMPSGFWSLLNETEQDLIRSIIAESQRDIHQALFAEDPGDGTVTAKDLGINGSDTNT